MTEWGLLHHLINTADSGSKWQRLYLGYFGTIMCWIFVSVSGGSSVTDWCLAQLACGLLSRHLMVCTENSAVLTCYAIVLGGSTGHSVANERRHLHSIAMAGGAVEHLHHRQWRPATRWGHLLRSE